MGNATKTISVLVSTCAQALYEGERNVKFSAARRLAAGVISLVVVGSAMSACSSGSGGSGGGPVTINMWARQGDNAIKDQLAA